MWCCVLCVLAVVSFPYVQAGLADDMAEITQQCCNQGTAYAIRHSIEDCSSLKPNVAPKFRTLCIFAKDQCCQEYYIKKMDCDLGIDLATSLRRCKSSNIVTKSCYIECLRGLSSGGTCSTEDKGNTAEEELAGEAYAQCCKKSSFKKNISDEVSSAKDTATVFKQHVSTVKYSWDDSSTPVRPSGPHRACPVGMRPKPGTSLCEDIDECKEGTHLCSPYQKCFNTDGSHECLCEIGFEIHGPTGICVDVNECARKLHTCILETQRCDNTIGSFTCISKEITEEYKTNLKPAQLENLPQVSSTTTSPRHETHSEASQITSSTKPTDSSPVTAKNSSPVASEPKEIEEREYDKTNIINPQSTKPILQPNYIPSDVKSVTETATVRGKKENAQDIPKNEGMEINNETIVCQKGFKLDESGACSDLNECATNQHTCTPEIQQCFNTVGSFLCIRHPNSREEISKETKTNLQPAHLDHPSEVSSTTTIPKLDLSSETQTMPSATSTVTPPLLSKNPPLLLPNQEKTEERDIDRTTKNIAQATEPTFQPHTPVDAPLGSKPTSTEFEEPETPSHRIPEVLEGQNPQQTGISRPDNESILPVACDRGFHLNSQTGHCEDIDECLTGEAVCGETQLCINILGGYSCSCKMGYRLNKDDECVDVDECSTLANNSHTSICSKNADCINTVGSYKCQCHDGFQSESANKKICIDVNECTKNNSLCEQRCNNLWGSYRCSCHKGYRLNPDNKTCEDINECTESKGLCIWRCLNNPGSYECSCPAGYRLSDDKRSCVDINECETGIAPCANQSSPLSDEASDVCFNTRGGYHCHRIECRQGYRLKSNRCMRKDMKCPRGDWECAHQPTVYSHNFITFVSKLYTGDIKKVNLFTMRGPSWQNIRMVFELRLVDVIAPPAVKRKADINDFVLEATDPQAILSLIRSIEGPQSIELELTMKLHQFDQFRGTAMAKLFIFVSQYEF